MLNPSPNQLALHVQNLHHRYDGDLVIEGLNLDLRAGEIGAILGPSGCGKSTLLRCVAGLEQIEGGTIHSFGDLLSSGSKHVPSEKRGVGMVFQSYALFPHLTVWQNLEFAWPKGKAFDAKRLTALLERFQIADLRDVYPHSISGGQQQRVALARALVPEPRVLLLDEPLSNLDAELKEAMKEDLRNSLKDLGIATLMVTHSLEEAYDISDRIGIYSKGGICQWTASKDLYRKPVCREAAEFTGLCGFIALHSDNSNGHWDTGLGPVARQDEPRLAIISCSSGPTKSLVVRPEQVVIRPDSPFQGKVLQTKFRGSFSIHELYLKASGEKVYCYSSTQDRIRIAVGETVGLALAL